VCAARIVAIRVDHEIERIGDVSQVEQSELRGVVVVEAVYGSTA
jgi:hypothetical protein